MKVFIKMKKKYFTGIILSILLVNCTEDDLPINPYDGINYGDTTLVIDTVSPYSFVKVHRDILSPSCNVMGCHDGSFEPDFRTVESSYNTLVYHPIIKNNLEEDFRYRVVPNDTALSVLHERLTNCCFVNTNDRMPQDNIGNSLEQEDLDLITNWILNGAKDITGAIPDEPNNMPNVEYFIVTNSTYDSTYSDNRVGNIFYQPFIMPENEEVIFIVYVEDDKTPPADLLVHKLEISEFQENYNNAIEIFATAYVAQYEVWVVPFNTSVLQSGKQYYFRYTVNDGESPNNTTYPNNQTSFIYKSIWSFTVQ
tara:strand:+ start:1 stop:930 length:930 start_codon:yes stop_codon:yes gene_type:complete